MLKFYTAGPYRTPAPPPPGPSWWESNKDRVVSAAIIVAGVVVAVLLGTCVMAVRECDEERKSEALRAFEERVRECPIVSIDHGQRQGDVVVVEMKCASFTERRSPPRGYKLPQP